jgi:hypothetical protein
MNRIQHDHPLRNFGGIINERPGIRVPPPDFEHGRTHLLLSYLFEQTAEISVASVVSCLKSGFVFILGVLA